MGIVLCLLMELCDNSGLLLGLSLPVNLHARLFIMELKLGL